jgi:excisionase family DNA binding protein
MEKMITVAQLSETLQVPAHWIRRRVREGVIPAVKVGRQLRFRESDIEAYLAKHSTVGPS